MASTLASTHAGQSLAWVRVLSFVSVCVIVVSPRSAPLILAIVGLAAGVVHWRATSRILPRLPRRPLTAVIIAFLLWALATALWAPDPVHAATKAAMLAVVASTAHICWRASAFVSRDVLRALLQGAATGMAIAGIVLAFEVWSNQYILRSVYTHFPSVAQPYARHLVIVDGLIVRVGETNINRRVFAWCLLLMPALAWMANTRRAGVDTALIAVTAAAAIVIGAFTTSQSSQLMLVAAGFFFLLTRKSRTWGLRLLAVAFAAMMLLTIPASIYAKKSGINTATWFFETARHRVNIWANTSSRIVAGQWWGVGVEGTAAIRHALSADLQRSGAEFDLFSSDLELARHAHNIYLQTWFELGVPGAALFTVIGLAAMAGMAAMSYPLTAYGVSFAGGAMASLATSYSMWQPWLIVVLALSVLMLRAAFIVMPR